MANADGQVHKYVITAECSLKTKRRYVFQQKSLSFVLAENSISVHRFESCKLAIMKKKKKRILFRHNFDPANIYDLFSLNNECVIWRCLSSAKQILCRAFGTDWIAREERWLCGQVMPSRACMHAMRSSVRNLFCTNKSIQQHGSPVVHNVPQLRLSGTNRLAHLTIWNPRRLWASETLKSCTSSGQHGHSFLHL